VFSLCESALLGRKRRYPRLSATNRASRRLFCPSPCPSRGRAPSRRAPAPRARTRRRQASARARRPPASAARGGAGGSSRFFCWPGACSLPLAFAFFGSVGAGGAAAGRTRRSGRGRDGQIDRGRRAVPESPESAWAQGRPARARGRRPGSRARGARPDRATAAARGRSTSEGPSRPKPTSVAEPPTTAEGFVRSRVARSWPGARRACSPRAPRRRRPRAAGAARGCRDAAPGRRRRPLEEVVRQREERDHGAAGARHLRCTARKTVRSGNRVEGGARASPPSCARSASGTPHSSRGNHAAGASWIAATSTAPACGSQCSARRARLPRVRARRAPGRRAAGGAGPSRPRGSLRSEARLPPRGSARRARSPGFRRARARTRGRVRRSYANACVTGIAAATATSAVRSRARAASFTARRASVAFTVSPSAAVQHSELRPLDDPSL
jgi:hypothetical protein